MLPDDTRTKSVMLAKAMGWEMKRAPWQSHIHGNKTMAWVLNKLTDGDNK